jgi:hypothetical protein
VWGSRVEGRTLHFRLAGINNQNFIMMDEETGTWWQQVSGEAIAGPLEGSSLPPVPWDEVSFAVWKREHPDTLVLLPDGASAPRYASADWEKRIAAYPTVTPRDAGEPLVPRDLVVGVALGDAATAYPWEVLEASGGITDEVGGIPILVLLHTDQRSVRCFDRRVDGEVVPLIAVAGSDPPLMADPASGTTWDFSGAGVEGSRADRRLSRIPCLKDYWFDWKAYHPATRVYALEAAGDPY